MAHPGGTSRLTFDPSAQDSAAPGAEQAPSAAPAQPQHAASASATSSVKAAAAAAAAQQEHDGSAAAELSEEQRDVLATIVREALASEVSQCP